MSQPAMPQPAMSEPQAPKPAAKPVATWRKVVAAILDFIFVFMIAGYAIAYLTGDLTEEGFSLKGGPAFMLFAIVIIYFVVFTRYLGGTVWQRLLGAR